jgi:hypothetical protein
MESPICLAPTNYEVDVHAPAKTYYTIGSNADNSINRVRSLSVNSHSYF